jgi:hypothetical protein
MSSKDLLFHNQKFSLSNPNPSQCWLPKRQIATHGDFSFCVITQIERSFLIK